MKKSVKGQNKTDVSKQKGKRIFIIWFLLITVLALFAWILLKGEPEYRRFSFIMAFDSARKSHFDININLNNYLPVDKDNNHFNALIESIERISMTDYTYLNKNGKILKNNTSSVTSGFIQVDFPRAAAIPDKISFKIKQQDYKNYWELNIVNEEKCSLNLFKIRDARSIRIHNTVCDLKPSRMQSIYIIFFKNRLFTYINKKIRACYVDSDPDQKGISSFKFEGKELQYEYTVRMGNISDEHLNSLEFRDFINLDPEYNFNILECLRIFDTNLTGWNRSEEFRYLRRIKCREFPAVQYMPYLPVTRPSIIFLKNCRLQYSLKVAPDSVLYFSLANFLPHYDLNYRTEFIITIKEEGKTKGDPYVFSFNHANLVFRDYKIDLRKYANRRCSFIFELRDNLHIDDSYQGEMIVALGSPVIYRKTEKNNKNVILISLDTLRQDHLSCYGYHRKTSPNIDAFAQESIMFTNAISNSNHTLASHMSLFTALYPSECGYAYATYSSRFMDNVFPYTVKLMGEYLEEIEYRNIAITGGNWVSSWTGYDRGFDYFVEWLGKDAKTSVKRAIAALENNMNYNFFLFLHTYEIHKPYERDFFQRHEKNIMPKPKSLKDQMIQKYDSGIHYADEYVGILIKWLKDHNLYNKTLIIITSDHGENFDLICDQDGTPGTHGETLYDSEIKIPLLIGGAIDGRDMGRKTMSVSNVDILPTILDYLDIEPGANLRGRSLLKLINMDERRTGVGYSERVNWNRRSMIEGKRAIRSSQYKLIENLNQNIGGQDKYEFYNLRNDKYEAKNLINSNVPALTNYKNILKKIVSTIIKSRVAPSKTSRFQKESYKTIIKRLENLGYILQN